MKHKYKLEMQKTNLWLSEGKTGGISWQTGVKYIHTIVYKTVN